jgi:HK97 family phage portal protein
MGLLDRVRAQQRNMSKPKAISHHPEMADRVHVVSQYGGSMAAEISDSFVGNATAYQSYTWLRKAIEITAKNVNPLPVRVVDADNQAMDNHPVSQLLARGNDTMSPSTIWDWWVVSMLLSGEGAIEIVNDRRGRPLWLWPRRPDLVLVLPDVSPERLDYPSVAGYVVMPDALAGAQQLQLTPQQLVFSKFNNPLNPWRGISPVSAVANSIVIDIYAQTWSKSFLKAGARPDFVVTAPQGLTQTEKDRIQGDVIHQFSGAENWHKPIILEDGTTIQPLTFPPVDVQWLEQRQFARDEVGAIIGVPDEIMGYGKDTYENFEAALKVYWTLTLRPLTMFRDTALTHHFTTKLPMLAPGERIATDLSSIGVLQEDKLPKVDMAVKLWQIGVPFNQLDAQLQLGVGAVPNGDLPFGKPPVEPLMIDATATPALPEPAKGAAMVQRPFLRTLTPGNITRDAWLTTKRMILQTLPDDDDAEEAIRREIERRAQRALTQALREQYRNLLPENAESMELWELEAYINSRLLDNQGVRDSIYRVVQDGADLGVNIALDQLGTLGMSFDYTLVNTRARDWAQRYVGELITQIDGTTRASVRQAVARWYENGEPLSALQRDLEPTFGADRAQMIAETETTAAASEGSYAGFQESGVVVGITFKTVNDEIVCPICGSLNGVTIGMDERFYDALPPNLQAKVKRQFKLPPCHPRCRCRTSPSVLTNKP